MQVYSEEALVIPPPMEYLEDVLSAYRQKVEDGVNALIDIMFTSGYKLFMFETDESSSLFSTDKVSRLATLNNLDRIFVSKNCNIQLANANTKYSDLITKSVERYKDSVKDRFSIIVDRDLYVKRRIVKSFKTVVFFVNQLQQLKFKPSQEGQLSIMIDRNLFARVYIGSKEISSSKMIFDGAGLVPINQWR